MRSVEVCPTVGRARQPEKGTRKLGGPDGDRSWNPSALVEAQAVANHFPNDLGNRSILVEALLAQGFPLLTIEVDRLLEQTASGDGGVASSRTGFPFRHGDPRISQAARMLACTPAS